MSTHPTVLEHHQAMHAKMLEHKEKFRKVPEQIPDHIDHHVINRIKEYNELTTKMIDNHNEKVRSIANEIGAPFQKLKNKYTIPVPEISKNLIANYCQYKPEEEFCSCDHDCEAEESKIESELKPTIAAPLKASKFQELKLDESHIPDEYKDIITVN